MRIHWHFAGVICSCSVLVFCCGSSSFGAAQPVSTTGLPSAPVAHGDSMAPQITPDGRYVLFASSAADLVGGTTNAPVSAPPPRRLNVYLRDRLKQTTELVSANILGKGANADSFPAGVSADGRYALFESSASDLVPNDTNGVSDVFIRDLAAHVTFLVSVGTNQSAGNGVSYNAALSPDGRFIAFVSSASDLVNGDTNGIPDVFLRDIQAGTTVLVSVGASSGGSPLTAKSDAPVLSPDGRYVAFYTTAAFALPGNPGPGQVLLRDLGAGTTFWASTNAASALLSAYGVSDAISCGHVLSDDGQTVAFLAFSKSAGSGVVLRFNVGTGQTTLVSTNAFVPLAAPEDVRSLDLTPDGRWLAFVAATNGPSQTTTYISVWDSLTGQATLVSGDSANQVPPNSLCDWPAISADGGKVAFLSNATNLVGNASVGDFNLYLRDLSAGSTVLLSSGPGGIGSDTGPLCSPSMTPDARFVAFEAPDGALTPGDMNRALDVFVRDTAQSANDLVSARAPQLGGLTPNGSSFLPSSTTTADGRVMPVLSQDGRLCVFSSDGDDLARGDLNRCRDLFLRDLVSGTNLLISVNTNGQSGDAASFDGSIAANGRYVVFTSAADDLCAKDTNRALDVFIRDLQTGSTVLVSVASDGVSPGNAGSYAGCISGDGRFVSFLSQATNLGTGTQRAVTGVNLFLRDLQTAATYVLTINGVNWATATADGTTVAYGAASGNGIWSFQSNNVSTLTGPAYGYWGISPDGTWLLAPNLLAINRTTHSSHTIIPSAAASPWGFKFSTNGQYVTFGTAGKTASPAAATNQVYRYELSTATLTLASRSYGTLNPANGRSEMPAISPDGRFIAFPSLATDIVPFTPSDNQPHLYLFDCSTGTTLLLDASAFGAFPANSRVGTPVFSPDSHALLFQSWAGDLVPGDLNQNSDLFTLALLNGWNGSLATLRLTPGTGASRKVTLTWPVNPGTGYSVQYKNALSDSAWLPLTGAVGIGSQGYAEDNPGDQGQRFYRVVLY